MAHLVGCMAMSHGPQLMLPPEQWRLLRNRESENLTEKPELDTESLEVKQAKWHGCMAAIEQLRGRVAALRPDVLIIVGDDQHENLLDDNMPPFSIFIGESAEASTSLHYLKQPNSQNRSLYRIHSPLAEALLTGLMEQGFDPAYCRQTRYDGGLGHAFARVLKFLMPEPSCRVIPVMVNTYYPPAPSAKRCAEFGRALARVLQRFPGAERLLVIGSGGLSHTIIDEELDRHFLKAVEARDLDFMMTLPASVLVEGTSEIRNWIVAAAAADCAGTVAGYFPLYRTRTGVGCAMGFAYWDLPRE